MLLAALLCANRSSIMRLPGPRKISSIHVFDLLEHALNDYKSLAHSTQILEARFSVKRRTGRIHGCPDA
jgi:hypothetical protein